MCDLLDTTDTPFGHVIADLRPARRTIEIDFHGPCAGTKGQATMEDDHRSWPAHLFEHRAVILTGQQQSVAAVVERYRGELISSRCSNVAIERVPPTSFIGPRGHAEGFGGRAVAEQGCRRRSVTSWTSAQSIARLLDGEAMSAVRGVRDLAQDRLQDPAAKAIGRRRALRDAVSAAVKVERHT